MIGFLRFIGVMNAAVWLGASVFFTFGVGPAIFSPAMKQVLGANSSPYFPGAIAMVLISRYFMINLVCVFIALFHLLAEWIYMGRPGRKFSLGLLTALLGLTLLGGYWLQPKIKRLHTVKYAINTPAPDRTAAEKSLPIWHGIAQILNLCMMGGLVVYVWRLANPSDTLRFVQPGSFRC